MSHLLSSRPLRQLAGIGLGAVLGLASSFAAEPEPGAVFEAFQQSLQSVFQKCCGAIVRVEAIDRHSRISGTGFFIDPNGTLYTSYTLGGESGDIRVFIGEQPYAARRLVSDRRSGVAVLKIDAETPFLPLGHASELSVASPVISIGYPLDFPLTPALGVVGGFDQKYQGRYLATMHLRASIPTQRGEGGAPLLNVKGEVVGILIGRIDPGAAFAIPIEAAEKVRRDFVRFHDVRPGWLGVHVKDLAKSVLGSTAFIAEVIAESPAEKAGLQAGDVLLQVGKLRVASLEDMINASFFLSAEDETRVRVSRDGAEQEFSVTPIDEPDLGFPAWPALGATSETSTPLLKIDR